MNGTINLKKLSTKMLDAISTLNTDVSNLTTSIPSQIKANNRQMLATVEQNAEASSREYVAGEYLAVNGKLYKALNNIAQGDALQENVNIEWVLLGDEVSNLRGSLKSAAYCTAVNNLDTVTPTGYVLDARVGPWIRNNINNLNTNTTSLQTRMAVIESKFVVKYVQDIAAVDGQGKVITNIPKDTSVWIYFPVSNSGYKLMGILGYYMYTSASSGSYYARNNIYHLMPTNDNRVAMAVTIGANGPWNNPRGAFQLLWQKI